MIGDNVVLRPPRLSHNTKRLITFAVRVARLMRWVSKTESPHTPLIRGSDPAETVELVEVYSVLYTTGCRVPVLSGVWGRDESVFVNWSISLSHVLVDL